MRICSIDGCSNKHDARGYCKKHYNGWKRHNNPTHKTRGYYNTPEESFAARTEWQGDCLLWTGATDSKGYGYIWVVDYTVGVHRYAWERVHGEIPEGIMIDHKYHCNTVCVNVEHLRPSTNAENMRNRPGAQKNSSSGHRNVSWDNRTKKWCVRLMKNRREYYIGTFHFLEDAIRSAEQARQELFGEFAGKG